MPREPGRHRSALAEGPTAGTRVERAPPSGPGPSSGTEFPALLSDLRALPPGSHCLEFYASEDEAAEHAAAFLAGAEDPNATSYWVADDRLLAFNRDLVARRTPGREENVRRLRGPQVVRREGLLRPTAEILRFVQQHPEGVSGAAATITRYWTREEIPAYLEYEAWFHEQARDRSRFLCPYDLRRVPVDMAAEVLPRLAEQHSHLVVSSARHPMALLVQLLVFPNRDRVPEAQREVLAWALRDGLLRLEGDPPRPVLVKKGEEFAEAFHNFEERLAENGGGAGT